MSCASNLRGYLPETKPDQNLYLFICLWSHDQDGHHSHTGYKPFKVISEIKKPAGLGMVCSIGNVGCTKFAKMMILDLDLLYIDHHAHIW